MKAIRFILKIMLLPVIIALTVIRLFAEFLAGISAVIFRSIAGIFLLTALLSYGFGLESTGEYKSEAACVAELMKRYEQLCTQQQNKKEQLI